MLNKCILIGRLTRDPESSYTHSGIVRTKFTLAVERNYVGTDGKRQADFIDVVAWRGLAENCNRYLRKGLMTAVVGRLEIRSYEAQDGQRRRIAEVVADEVRFLEWPKDGQAPGSVQAVAAQFEGKVLGADEWGLPF
ncbi:MAG: single-stranded DNA-binding protein [Bacillota bacterium]|nr:single-stranded DNA-binding protein [Bacillota bacterium]